MKYWILRDERVVGEAEGEPCPTTGAPILRPKDVLKLKPGDILAQKLALTPVDFLPYHTTAKCPYCGVDDGPVERACRCGRG